MEKYNYSCDAGSVLVGTTEFQVRLQNGFGDGYFDIYVVDNGEIDLSEYRFNTTIAGTFTIYDYDCLSETELKMPDHKLTELNGYYGVYYNDGTVVFEDWNRYR